jgi:hypothetical protein
MGSGSSASRFLYDPEKSGLTKYQHRLYAAEQYPASVLLTDP